LSDLFLALPAMRRFHQHWVVQPLPGLPHLLRTLLDTWHEASRSRTVPSIAIVDWSDAPTQSEFRLVEHYAQATGVPCRDTAPEARSGSGGRLRAAGGTVLNLVGTRVLLHELVAQGGIEHPLLAAMSAGAVVLVNGVHGKPLQKKAALAVLTG